MKPKGRGSPHCSRRYEEGAGKRGRNHLCANEEAASMKQRAEESIEREKKRAVNEIKEEISDMVVMAASKVAEKEINAQDNEKIIDSVLSQIGKEN